MLHPIFPDNPKVPSRIAYPPGSYSTPLIHRGFIQSQATIDDRKQYYAAPNDRIQSYTAPNDRIQFYIYIYAAPTDCKQSYTEPNDRKQSYAAPNDHIKSFAALKGHFHSKVFHQDRTQSQIPLGIQNN